MGWPAALPTTRLTYFGFVDTSYNTFVTAGSDDGITWQRFQYGSWADHINAPMVLQYRGRYYFHVSTTYDNNFFLPWLVGLSDSTGVVTTIATIDWAGKIVNAAQSNSGEWFVETDGSVHVFVPIGTSLGSPAGFQMYESHALETNGGATCVTASVACPLTFWSDPVFVQVHNIGGTGTRTDIYDPKVYKIGSTYYMWMTHEDDRYIELATSSTLLGPYTLVRAGDWAGWGTMHEGPTLYRPNGAGSWRIAMEPIITNPLNHKMQYSDCNNDDFLSCTWTALQRWNEAVELRHGSIVGPN